jgi:hypothetical protein
MFADPRVAGYGRLVLATLVIALSLPASRALAASGPVVQAMVVGSSGQVIAGPRSVTASAATVAVGRKRCTVAGGTPLAVLADLRGPSFAIRDYGRCGSSAANSSSLFVYDLAGEQNSGRNGWEYKVGGIAGSTGAADPSGTEGNGRLLGSGAQVLWFYCHATAGGCQRTLALSAPTSATHGAHLTVHVTGYDNEGRGVPVSGVVVSLGSDFATTNGSGNAVVIAPSGRGSYSLSARRRGLVPAFPRTVAVR